MRILRWIIEIRLKCWSLKRIFTTTSYTRHVYQTLERLNILPVAWWFFSVSCLLVFTRFLLLFTFYLLLVSFCLLQVVIVVGNFLLFSCYFLLVICYVQLIVCYVSLNYNWWFSKVFCFSNTVKTINTSESLSNIFGLLHLISCNQIFMQKSFLMPVWFLGNCCLF